MVVLAGDIGGTKVHLALFRGSERIADQRYPSQDYPTFLEIVQQFISENPQQIEKACFGVAGPITKGISKITNLPWTIIEEELTKELKIQKVWLINDIEAHANGVQHLDDQDFLILNEGNSLNGNAAMIASGTGLGEAGLIWDGKKHQIFACEGGHVDFAPRDDLEIELLQTLRKKFGHVSYERVVSGPGIQELFNFLIEVKKEKKPSWLLNIDEKEDLSKLITQKALSGECALCIKVLEWFVSLYGSAAGNLALKFLTLNGIYIGGGIAPKILPALKSGSFLKSFKDKGRFESLLSKVPVKVCLNDDIAILGALEYASSHDK